MTLITVIALLIVFAKIKVVEAIEVNIFVFISYAINYFDISPIAVLKGGLEKISKFYHL